MLQNRNRPIDRLTLNRTVNSTGTVVTKTCRRSEACRSSKAQSTPMRRRAACSPRVFSLHGLHAQQSFPSCAFRSPSCAVPCVSALVGFSAVLTLSHEHASVVFSIRNYAEPNSSGNCPSNLHGSQCRSSELLQLVNRLSAVRCGRCRCRPIRRCRQLVQWKTLPR